MKTLIEKLISTPGPSGYEGKIRDLIRAEVEPYADEVRVDALGNLIARKGSGGTRIMLAAHMDEIGVIATHIDENGFIRFSNLGGVYPRYLPGGRVRFLDGTLGVINTERVNDPKKTPAMDKMFIEYNKFWNGVQDSCETTRTNFFRWLRNHRDSNQPDGRHFI
jgi:endoglucanase